MAGIRSGGGERPGIYQNQLISILISAIFDRNELQGNLTSVALMDKPAVIPGNYTGFPERADKLSLPGGILPRNNRVTGSILTRVRLPQGLPPGEYIVWVRGSAPDTEDASAKITQNVTAGATGDAYIRIE